MLYEANWHYATLYGYKNDSSCKIGADIHLYANQKEKQKKTKLFGKKLMCIALIFQMVSEKNFIFTQKYIHIICPVPCYVDSQFDQHSNIIYLNS